MIWLDIIAALFFAGFVVSGARRGLILTAGQLVGAVIGFLLARIWAPWFGSLIAILIPTRPGLAQFIAFILILIIVERLFGIVVSLVNSVLKIITALPLISSVDALLGVIVGFVEGIVFVGASVYVITTLKLDATLIAWANGSWIAKQSSVAFQYLLGFLL